MAHRPITFKINQKIGRYRVAQSPKQRGGTETAHPIGRGGSAAVFLVKQELGNGRTIDRALKLFDPSPKIVARRGNAEQTPGRQSFANEIEAISSLTHQNLVKIIDAGKFRENRPYFVMEYVNGAPLKSLLDRSEPAFLHWKRKANKDPFLILRMAQQICWPISYLHSQRFFHFDIAPKNIFVGEVNSKPHVIVGDLGVGKKIPEKLTQTASRELIFIAGTKAHTPPELLSYLTDSKKIEMGELARYAAYWDLYALATTIQMMMNAWELSSHPDLEATSILCQRMLKYDEKLDSVKISAELDRLLPAHVRTAGVEELSTDALGRREYINIPLYSVPVSKRVRKLIHHANFTRLQSVPQLLLVRSVFPGGVHTVYEHVLGSFTLMLRCLTKLLSLPKFRANFSGKELEEALVSVLLLKIASFPLDRVFFGLYPTRPDGLTTRDIITERLERRTDGESLASLLQEHFEIDLNAVLPIVCDEKVSSKEPYQKIISGLLRSSIDVRVMDYLVRDSHHTGIPAGLGIDVGNIVDSLTWTEREGVGITPSGVFSVEHLLSARYWMFSRVYWNQHNRSITSMLRHVIYSMKSERFNPSEFVRCMMDVDQVGALNLLNTQWKENANYNRYTEILDLLTQSHPRTYEAILELRVPSWAENQKKLVRSLTSERLEELGETFRNRIAFGKDLVRGDILFDIPHEDPLKLGEDIYVVHATSDGVTHEEPLTGVSDIVATLPNAFLRSAVTFRVFCHPGIVSKMNRNRIQEIRSFLYTEFPNLFEGPAN